MIPAGFLVWQARCPAPMIRLSMFRVRRFSTINLATFLLYFAVTGIGFYLPKTAMSAWRADALSMTAAFLSGALMIAPLATVVLTLTSDADQGSALRINNDVARAASLLAVALMGRMASSGYGAFGAETPGLGVNASEPTHVAATRVGFAHLATLAAVASLASALVSAWGLRRSN